MLVTKTTENQRAKALELATPLMKRYANNEDSIKRGKGHYIGKLAELVAVERLNRFGLKHINTYDADTEAILVSGNSKIEIKTKDRTVPPRGYYNASVAAANTKQVCDLYLFCSSLNDEIIYIIGIISKAEFFEKSVFYKEGDLDPDGPKGMNWKFRADCYNLKYNLMSQIGKTPLLD